MITAVSSVFAVLCLIRGIRSYSQLSNLNMEEAFTIFMPHFGDFMLFLAVAYAVDKLNACLSYLKNITNRE